MTKVHALRGVFVPTTEPNKALVAALKDILADAESGLLQSFIAAGFRSDGLRMSCFLGEHANAYEVIGSIEMLKRDYIDGHMERV